MEFCACSMLNTVNTAEQHLAEMGLQSNKSSVSLIKHRLNFEAKFGFTFHHQLMHPSIKTLSQFTFKTTHVKNVCAAYLKLIKNFLKNPTCFGRSSDHHQGLVPVPCTITTSQPACFFAFQFVAVCCLYVYACVVLIGDHTDKYNASIHIQTTYHHKLECEETGRLTSSNCTRHGN